MKKELQQYHEQFARETGVIADIHAEDFIFQFLIEHEVFNSKKDAIKYYYFDGQNSARQIDDILYSKLYFERANSSVLEFAAGYGCITRHLLKIIPSQHLFCSDIHPEANQFLAETFDVKTIQSTTKPKDFQSNLKFDVVIAVSFFSHMPPTTWGEWLETLFSLVNPKGALVFTTQGMASRVHLGNPTIPESGIYFLAESEQKDLDVNYYGQTLVTIAYVVNQVISRLAGAGEFKIIQPAFWWEHQDLFVIRKF
ncbi:class I SAM-dependent methyltransferase [candidate division CSSED10-310 bacterium]|uniref:Class I SAM-dependent methyltransferase n=1 Tax=candidate division CSSED10-310 bacterium TaxID=2855610 RepID=A0ABV6YVR6_UNCC1